MRLFKTENLINFDLVSDGGAGGGLVFGIPLNQCVENDRLRSTGRTDLVHSPEERPTIARHGSRSSFSSLIDSPRGDEVKIKYFCIRLKKEGSSDLCVGHNSDLRMAKY